MGYYFLTNYNPYSTMTMLPSYQILILMGKD